MKSVHVPKAFLVVVVVGTAIRMPTNEEKIISEEQIRGFTARNVHDVTKL